MIKCHFPQYFSYKMVVSFICGGSRSTRQTLSHNVVSSTPRHEQEIHNDHTQSYTNVILLLNS